MREIPLIFKGQMVRAILDGRKTQTRRVVRDVRRDVFTANYFGDGSRWFPSCPYGQPGDRLWVRETWKYDNWTEDGEPKIRYAADGACEWRDVAEQDADKVLQVWADLSVDANYSIDGAARDRRWRPSIFMPRWASRITLEVIGVRVERLLDISEADAQAEGVERHLDGWFPYGIETFLTTLVDGKEVPAQFSKTAAYSFRMLWESINGEDSWDANPWVWVVEFRRLEGRDDG